MRLQHIDINIIFASSSRRRPALTSTISMMSRRAAAHTLVLQLTMFSRRYLVISPHYAGYLAEFHHLCSSACAPSCVVRRRARCSPSYDTALAFTVTKFHAMHVCLLVMMRCRLVHAVAGAILMTPPMVIYAIRRLRCHAQFRYLSMLPFFKCLSPARHYRSTLSRVATPPPPRHGCPPARPDCRQVYHAFTPVRRHADIKMSFGTSLKRSYTPAPKIWRREITSRKHERRPPAMVLFSTPACSITSLCFATIAAAIP